MPGQRQKELSCLCTQSSEEGQALPAASSAFGTSSKSENDAPRQILPLCRRTCRLGVSALRSLSLRSLYRRVGIILPCDFQALHF